MPDESTLWSDAILIVSRLMQAVNLWEVRGGGHPLVMMERYKGRDEEQYKEYEAIQGALSIYGPAVVTSLEFAGKDTAPLIRLLHTRDARHIPEARTSLGQLAAWVDVQQRLEAAEQGRKKANLDDRQTPPPRFDEWGLGLDGERCQVFHRIDSDWHHRGELKLRPGRERLLMRLMLEGQGRLTIDAVSKAEAVVGRSANSKLKRRITETLSRITTELFKVMPYLYEGPPNARPQPFGYDDADRTPRYQAKVYLGAADWTDGGVAGAREHWQFEPTTNPTHDR